MNNEIEIELKIGNRTLFEYHSPTCPKIGETMSVDVDENQGLYEVNGVTHHIFRDKKTLLILSYVSVDLKALNSEDWR